MSRSISGCISPPHRLPAHPDQVAELSRPPQSGPGTGPALVRSDHSVQQGCCPLEFANLVTSPPKRASGGATRNAQVHVVGVGPTPAAIAEVLVHTGEVRVVRVGSPRTRTQARCDLAIIVSADPVSVEATQGWQQAKIPHLPLHVQPSYASIGPLIVPGKTPCVQCLELTRSEVDPDWPLLRSQLTRARQGVASLVRCDASLLAILAGFTSALVRVVLATDYFRDGRSLDLAIPGPHLEERHWPIHPLCRCTAPSALEA